MKCKNGWIVMNKWHTVQKKKKKNTNLHPTILSSVPRTLYYELRISFHEYCILTPFRKNVFKGNLSDAVLTTEAAIKQGAAGTETWILLGRIHAENNSDDQVNPKHISDPNGSLRRSQLFIRHAKLIHPMARHVLNSPSVTPTNFTKAKRSTLSWHGSTITKRIDSIPFVNGILLLVIDFRLSFVSTIPSQIPVKN